MEKDIFLKDYLVSRVMSMGKVVDGYSRLYYKANEDLVDQCLDVDFYHKDVLSVLASSDQVLTARYLEANTVDAFDFNRLTIYYFYLRIWSLKYRNELYPLVLRGNNKWLATLLRLVKPSTEMEQKALEFFKKHVKEGTNFINLFYEVDKQPIGRTLYTKPEELSDCLDSELSFHHLDLFKQFDLEKTYDILLISNILEWARGDKTKLQIAKDNLSRLLNKDGVVICSKLINQSNEVINQERDIFSDSFTYDEEHGLYIKK